MGETFSAQTCSLPITIQRATLLLISNESAACRCNTNIMNSSGHPHLSRSLGKGLRNWQQFQAAAWTLEESVEVQQAGDPDGNGHWELEEDRETLLLKKAVALALENFDFV